MSNDEVLKRLDDAIQHFATLATASESNEYTDIIQALKICKTYTEAHISLMHKNIPGLMEGN